MPLRTIAAQNDLDDLRGLVTAAAATSLAALNNLQLDQGPLRTFAQLRFSRVGRHPIEDRELNLVEQMNQTFTYLATFAAAEYLIAINPLALPMTLRLGAMGGTDIESEGADIAAEVFAATHRDSNDKLQDDVAKVAQSPRATKYVFFFCPGDHCEPFQAPSQPAVTVVPLTPDQVFGPP